MYKKLLLYIFSGLTQTMICQHQVSISSTFDEQLLHAQIPKALKRLTPWLSFLCFCFGIKAAHRTLMKLTPGVALGKMVTIKNRIFCVGGIYPGTATASYIYEWTELQGWTIFSKMSTAFASSYLAAIPYNID